MLGDAVEKALALVGVTEDWVRRWVGECCCKERRDRLNQLDLWARRVVGGRVEKAAEYLKGLIDE